MEHYKEKGINPFIGIFIFLVQFPILIGLYQVFLKSGLPNINTDILYSFVSKPENIKMTLFGFFDISHKSIFLALIAGITSYFQIKYQIKF